MQLTLTKSVFVMLFLALFLLQACKDGQTGKGNIGINNEYLAELNRQDSLKHIEDSLAALPKKPEIRLQYSASNVAPSGSFHVFACYDVFVLAGDFSVEDLENERFTMTILYADTSFARILHKNGGGIRQVATFEMGEKNVPRQKMPISGFVDKHMTAWHLKYVQYFLEELPLQPTERPE